MNLKVPLIRNPKWLDKVRAMPCILSGRPGPSDPAHIRHGLGGGMGIKPGDNRVLPLNHELHAIQHNIGEVRFWVKYLPSDPDLLMECVKAYAEKLYRENNP